MERTQYSFYSSRWAGSPTVDNETVDLHLEREQPVPLEEAGHRLHDRKIEEQFFVRANIPAIMRKGQEKPVLLLPQNLKISGSYFSDDNTDLLIVAENKVLLLRNISSQWRILERFTSIDERERDTGDTVLMAAIIQNNQPLAALLIKAGCNINAYNHKGRFPLYMAVARERLECVSLLIRGRADIRQRTKDIEQALPLHCAVMTNRIDITRILLSAMQPEDVNRMCRESGCTPLHIAAYLGHTGMCEVLYQYQGDIHQQIIREGRLDEDDAFQQGYTALHLAVARNNILTTRWLISKGADVDAISARRQTPLHIAAGNGFMEQARVLLDSGADIDAICNDDEATTPLFKAVRYNMRAMTAYLIEKQADINLRSWSNSLTPLHYAVSIENIPIVHMLVNAGCSLLNPEVQLYRELFDITPLRLAIKKNNFTICVILLQAHTIWDIDDIAYAIRRKHFQLGNFLFRMYTSSVRSDLASVVRSSWVTQHMMHTAILSNDIHQLIHILRTRTVNANTPRASDGCRPIHLALLVGKPDIVSLLLHLGAKCQKRNKDGYLPLFMANNDEVADLVRLWSGELQPQSLRALTRKVLWQYLGPEVLNLYQPEFSSSSLQLAFVYHKERTNPLRLRATSKEIMYGRMRHSASFNAIHQEAMAESSVPNVTKYGLSLFSANSLLMDYLRLSIPPVLNGEVQAA